MSRNPITDDPRLTAYALDELNAADRAAVERQIGESVETLLEIEAIREVAEQLGVALREESFGTPSLPHRERVLPMSASVTADAAPQRRTSGRFAVAASCLAMVGAFGIVAMTGGGNRLDDNKFASRSGPLVWSGVKNEVALTDRLDRLNEFETLGSEGRLSQVLTKGAQASFQHNPIFQEAESVAVATTQVGGLGEFDVTAVGKGPNANRGVSEKGAEANGFGGGSRQTTLASGGGTAASGLHIKGRAKAAVRPLFTEEAPKTAQPLNRSFSIAASQPQSQRSRTQTYAGGLLQAGRGVPLDLESNSIAEVTKLKKELAAIKESKSRPEKEDHLLRRNETDGRAPTAEALSAEAYAAIHDNPFTSPLQAPLSTFSIDVDTAAYSNMRRYLTQGSWPPVDSVRIEELVNYFSYDYAGPVDGERAKAEEKAIAVNSQRSTLASQPFAVHMEVAGCPWNADHRLVRVGLKGKEIALDRRPVSNLVFLIDVSGSMQPENKLPLVKAGIRRLVDQLGENDRVGIVVYAGASGLALDSTNATQKDAILSAIENLQAGGSTNGGEGIQLAYALARKHFITKGTNRVILCTDGDFNVGITNQDDLTRLIEEESKSGVFLSVLGFGMGNLKDSTLEKLADKGNGNYAYIDTLREANKVFVEQMTGTLITIAKDVKIQIEFNPSQVGAYRLIGYENRLLATQDFNDDTKDAGEIGAGHSVTALYEIIPPNKLPAPAPVIEERLKYQPTKDSGDSARRGPSDAVPPQDRKSPVNVPGDERQASRLSPRNNELMTIKLRYKQPDGDNSSLIEMPLTDAGRSFGQASTDFRFAASVASFGMILRHSPHRGSGTLDLVLELAQSSLGTDKSGYRSEFVGLVRLAKALSK